MPCIDHTWVIFAHTFTIYISGAFVLGHKKLNSFIGSDLVTHLVICNIGILFGIQNKYAVKNRIP